MSTQFVGRDVLVNFAIGVESDEPSALTFKRLGMMRGKEMDTSWDTVDTTADMSPAFTKTNLVTFKMMTFTGDGVSYGEDVANQKEFKSHVISPGAGTDNQPKVWLQMIDPDGDQYEGPFIVNQWSDSRPYADAATWSMSAMSNGDVAFTVGP